MKKYKLILFDFDGTLVDTVADIAYYANAVLSDYGFRERPVAEVRKAIGWGVHELLKGLTPEAPLDGERLEQAVDLFKKKYREKPVRLTKPFPHVTAMLEGPLAAVSKAIVTNKPQDITGQILKELGLDRHFLMTIGTNAGFPPKPDSSGTLHVMKTLSFPPEAVVYVGDSGVDAALAENAGIDFAWVSYGYDRPEKGGHAFTFSSAQEWGRLLE